MDRVVFLLGPFRVQDGERVVERLATRRAQSLLIYLALHLGRRVTRASLLELLWAHDDVDTARKALRQALYFIRQAVPDAIQSSRDEVWLDSEVWTTDLKRIEAASTIAELNEAALLAGEPFAPWDGEEWTDGPRLEFEPLQAQVADRLARRVAEEAATALPVPLPVRARGPRRLLAGATAALLLTGLVAFQRRSEATVARPVATLPDWEVRLAQLPAMDETRRVDVLATFSDAAFAAAYGKEEASWQQLAGRHLNDVDQAVRWSLKHRPRAAVRIASGIWRFAHLNGELDRSRVWLTDALAANRNDDSLYSARAEAALAFSDVMEGRPGAREHALRSLSLYQRSGDDWGQAHAMRALGFAYAMEQTAAPYEPAARQWYERARNGFSRLGDEAGVAVTEICMSTRSLDRTEQANHRRNQVIDERIGYALEAHRHYVSLGNPWGIGFSMDRAWTWITNFGTRERSRETLIRLAAAGESYADRGWQFGSPDLRYGWLGRAALLRHEAGDREGFRRMIGRLCDNSEFQLRHPRALSLALRCRRAEPMSRADAQAMASLLRTFV